MQWAELSKKVGRLPLTEVLKPAISYAREGYPATPLTAYSWLKAYNQFREIFKDDCRRGWFETFAPGGKVPNPGDMVCLKDHGDILAKIAATNAETFYRGELVAH